MAATIGRTGKVVSNIFFPIAFLTVLIYSNCLPKQAKAEQPNQSLAQEELLKQAPIWTEHLSQRNSNNRDWEVTKWQKKVTSKTGEINIVEVKSKVREKGCGICYKDSNDAWQITDTSWRQTETGFVMDKAGYILDMGKTADSLLYYDIDGETLTLKADSIKVYDGQNITKKRWLNGKAFSRGQKYPISQQTLKKSLVLLALSYHLF